MNISIKIIIDAIKNLPLYSQWGKDEWVYRYESVDKTKCRTLLFRKNEKTYSWDLIV